MADTKKTTNEAAGELQKLVDDWNSAEVAIKRAEQVSSQIVMPAVMELRYAGRRLVEYLSEEDEIRKKSLLRDAQNDALRAKFDAIDAIVATISIHLDKMMKKRLNWGLVDGEVLKELMDQLSHVHNKISKSRHDRSARLEIYEEISELELSSLIEKYNQVRVTWAAYAKRTVWKRSSTFGVAVGIIGVAISVLAAFLRAG